MFTETSTLDCNGLDQAKKVVILSTSKHIRIVTEETEF